MLLSVPTNVTVWLMLHGLVLLLPFALLGSVFEYAQKTLGNGRWSLWLLLELTRDFSKLMNVNQILEVSAELKLFRI